MVSLLSILLALTMSSYAQDPPPYDTSPNNDGSLPYYSPGRAPALPLAVRSPYTSAWISTVDNGTLNTNGAIFWNGDPLGWEGLITVDGVTYEYLGTGMSGLPRLSNLTKAIPYSVSYDSQYSNFSLGAGPVRVTARFLSPVLPTDLCRTSIPLSYFEASFETMDGMPHDVQLYSDVNSRWIANDGSQQLGWDMLHEGIPINGTEDTDSSNALYNWSVYVENPSTFGEDNDHPQWGNFSYASTPGSAKGFQYQSGFANDIRYRFVTDHALNDYVDAKYRSSDTQEPIFAFAHDFGSSTSGSALYTVGTIQDPMIRYLSSGGVVDLRPWWTTDACYGSMQSMIKRHYQEYNITRIEAARWDTQLRQDITSYYSANEYTAHPTSPYSNGSQNIYTNGIDQFGQAYIFDPSTAYGFLTPNGTHNIPIPFVSETESYYAILALSCRQTLAAYVLVESHPNSDSPFMFQKEVSSNGNINTVDVIYPAMPFFLYANPELLRMVLDPIFEIQERGFYTNGWSIHDLGSSFPNATGHVEGDEEAMPVEECGNMLIMAYAYYRFSCNTEYLGKHYERLKQFAQYLIDFSLVPGRQLSTDDFAGKLNNQTNLAIKGIVALNAISAIATTLSHPTDASHCLSISNAYFISWRRFGIDPSDTHTLLSYQHRSSWGLLYNIYPSLLLNLTVVPRSLFTLQSAFYPTVAQIFGVPLDNRHHYTKSDWQLWAAASSLPSTRRLFVNAIAYWLNHTSTDRAFTDWYETVGTGGDPEGRGGFVARPVAGGHFSLLALWRAGMHKVLEEGGNTTVPGWDRPLPGRNESGWYEGKNKEEEGEGVIYTGQRVDGVKTRTVEVTKTVRLVGTPGA